MDDTSIKSLTTSAEWINGLLVGALSAAGVIVLLKLFKKGQFEFHGVMLSVGYTWLVMLLVTTAHIYLTMLFVHSAVELFGDPDDGLRQKAWDELVRAGPLFFRGLLPRLEQVSVPGVTFRLYSMSLRDPTTWLAHGAAILLFLSVIRIRKASWLTRVGTFFAGAILCFANWIAGSNWAIAASELTLKDKKQSFLLARLVNEKMPNKALEPTPTAVTPPAAHEPHQP